ncbi:hypothetical protein CVT26_012831 [Gymnopilus dilepis]|uniref:Uncharacterized protein n=1 Tax=Gymnopilus dilepis TaxID=231916 RepID=A0A409Y489_9AGAR|nr:hypothetical protein CVT26_012831 [Gymnopilus dilepis]
MIPHCADPTVSPNAHASELFVLLRGMLFTNIQLEDFQPMLAHFMELHKFEGAEDHEWIMMDVIDISFDPECGRPNDVLCHLGSWRVGPKEVNSSQVAAAMFAMVKKAAAGVLASSSMAVVPATGRSSSAKADSSDNHNLTTDHPPAQVCPPPDFFHANARPPSPMSTASQHARLNINPYFTPSSSSSSPPSSATARRLNLTCLSGAFPGKAHHFLRANLTTDRGKLHVHMRLWMLVGIVGQGMRRS